ncbi:hypothetical protein EAY45_25750, partial [Vibrio anguillarum]|nr:hypothetical protein [Vibrio anguillarum]
KLVCHYIEDEGNLRLKSVEIESNELGEFKSDSFDIVRGLDESALSCVKSYLTDFSRVSFISAERIGPRSFHESASNRTFGVGKFGEHTALEIYRNREKNVRQELIHSSGETPKLPDQISAWVSYIFNSGTVSVSSISESLKKIVISPDGS